MEDFILEATLESPFELVPREHLQVMLFSKKERIFTWH